MKVNQSNNNHVFYFFYSFSASLESIHLLRLHERPFEERKGKEMEKGSLFGGFIILFCHLSHKLEKVSVSHPLNLLFHSIFKKKKKKIIILKSRREEGRDAFLSEHVFRGLPWLLWTWRHESFNNLLKNGHVRGRKAFIYN